MKVLGLVISIIQGLAIAAIYAINPAGVSYQAGWLILCMIGSVGPSVIVTAKGRSKIVGLVIEGLYLFALYQLYVWVMYYSGLSLL
jgi:hypothetical protein